MLDSNFIVHIDVCCTVLVIFFQHERIFSRLCQPTHATLQNVQHQISLCCNKCIKTFDRFCATRNPSAYEDASNATSMFKARWLHNAIVWSRITRGKVSSEFHNLYKHARGKKFLKPVRTCVSFLTKAIVPCEIPPWVPEPKQFPSTFLNKLKSVSPADDEENVHHNHKVILQWKRWSGPETKQLARIDGVYSPAVHFVMRPVREFTSRQLRLRDSQYARCSTPSCSAQPPVADIPWFYGPNLHSTSSQFRLKNTNRSSSLTPSRIKQIVRANINQWVRDSPPMSRNFSLSETYSARNGGTFCFASINRCFRSNNTDSSETQSHVTQLKSVCLQTKSDEDISVDVWSSTVKLLATYR